MTNHGECFAETSEVFLGTKDFLPFARESLKWHGPEMFRRLVRQLQSVRSTPYSKDSSISRTLLKDVRPLL